MSGKGMVEREIPSSDLVYMAEFVLKNTPFFISNALIYVNDFSFSASFSLYLINIYICILIIISIKQMHLFFAHFLEYLILVLDEESK